jgi:hypothetical protein
LEKAVLQSSRMQHHGKASTNFTRALFIRVEHAVIAQGVSSLCGFVRSPANQLALLFVFGPVDLAASKAAIENINCRWPSCADGRPICHPNKESG